MRETIVKISCDRCGSEVKGAPVKIIPSIVKRDTGEPYNEQEIHPPKWMEKMMDKEFCSECAQRILDISMIRE